jgi:hypothetical protein
VARAKRAGGDAPGSGAGRGGIGARAPTREATRPGKGADASEELERERRTEELKPGGGRGGVAGRARGARAGGIGIAVWCSAGGARVVKCVATAAREVSEGESEAKRERGRPGRLD